MKPYSLITCNALKYNIEQLLKYYHFNGTITYLDAGLHNLLNLLNERVKEAFEADDLVDTTPVIGYGKCCEIIEELSDKYDAPYTRVENCYHLFIGDEYYDLLKEVPGTYFLTNYLTENFEELIIKPLKIDIYPQIKEMMFKHYKRIIFIDTEDTGLTQAGKDVAIYLGLPIVYKKADLIFFEKIMLSLGIFPEKDSLSLL